MMSRLIAREQIPVCLNILFEFSLSSSILHSDLFCNPKPSFKRDFEELHWLRLLT